MFINSSNLPSKKWKINQREWAIIKFESIVDLQFPKVLSKADHEFVKKMTLEYLKRITHIQDVFCNEPKPNTVHLQAEFPIFLVLVSLTRAVQNHSFRLQLF